MINFFIPVMDRKDLTARCLPHLADTVTDKDDFRLIIVDNCSDPPYSRDDLPNLHGRIPIIMRNDVVNAGMFYPIVQIDTDFPGDPDDIIGCIHNDVFIYEPGWDLRIKEAFKADPLLACVGFCGSAEVDQCGGRGGDTKCYFEGRDGCQKQSAGRRITGLEPAAILDSLAMFFRRSAIPTLRIDENIAPYHFYDKILPLRLIDAGFHVAVLGIRCDHMGGQTAVTNGGRFEPYAAAWCRKHDIRYTENQAQSAIYVEAERRMFAEFAPKGLIPCRVNPDYSVSRMYGMALNANALHPQNVGRSGY